ncbi:hypothetical protein EON81_25890, partial [bacterium]
DLQRAMNSLSPEQRLLVTLADIEGVPYKDIAEMLDKPVGRCASSALRLGLHGGSAQGETG